MATPAPTPISRSFGTLAEDCLAVGLFCGFPVVAFYGYKYWKWCIAALGFGIAGYVTFWGATDGLGDVMSSEAIAALALGVGLLAGWFLVKVYTGGVLALGALGGLTASNLVYKVLLASIDGDPSDNIRIGVLVACILIGAIISYKAFREFSRLITAFLGGYMCVASVSYCAERSDWHRPDIFSPMDFFADPGRAAGRFDCDASFCLYMFLLWSCIFVAGSFWQIVGPGYGEARPSDRYEEERPVRQPSKQMSQWMGEKNSAEFSRLDSRRDVSSPSSPRSNPSNVSNVARPPLDAPVVREPASPFNEDPPERTPSNIKKLGKWTFNFDNL